MQTDDQIHLLRQRIDWLVTDGDLNQPGADLLNAHLALVMAALDEDLQRS